ncbi:hypothetical protein ACGFIF_13665 [Kribbella sp. NPDC049174]|uniref:hypothetical protein n=1 Tax=Kribbella sp. NPDC049174 TaxID=3364112 RepID=UPI0037158359
MADPAVNDLIRTLNQLVVNDTGGRSLATGDQVPGVTLTTEAQLRLLADNLDIPARLAPSPAAVLNRGSGEAYDQRVAIRAALTEAVASCANTLEPRRPLPEPADRDHRDRLGTALSRAYAAAATPRLAPRLIPNGRPDDLGVFAPPVLEGDVAAARALALAIGARLDRRDEDVLAALVGAGRGAAAPTAARLVLDTKPGFATLPGPEQDAAVRLFAQRLESGFASREPRAAAARELTEEVENRRQDIAGGATAVDTPSKLAADEIQKLHAFLDRLPDWHPANQARAAARATQERPESVDQLVRRIERTVGELTGARQTLWNDEIKPQTGQSPDRTLRLTEQQALALRQLTENGTAGPLAPEQLTAAREGILAATTSYARWAVPDDYTWRHEQAAAAVAPRFATLEQAVSTAFAEDNFNEIVDRTLPADLAKQVRLPSAPRLDETFAPAARGLANAIDTATGRAEGETLRRLAGEGRAGIAVAAAEAVVADSDIPNVERSFAVRMIAEEIDTKFDELPAQLESWSAGEPTGMWDRDVDDPHVYGQQVGRSAERMAEIYGEDPGLAQRESVAADRTAAQHDSVVRFAPGHDPASAGFGGVKAPANSPAASQSATPEQPRPRGLEGR